MITIRDVQQAQKRGLGTTEEKRDLIRAITRLVNGNLTPPNRPGTIYVQEYFNQNRVMIVANPLGISTPDTPVWVGPDPRNQYQYCVLKVAQEETMATPGGGTGASPSSIPDVTFVLHHQRHESLTEGSAGDDVVRFLQPADYRLKTVADGTLTLLLYPLVYHYNDLPYQFGGAAINMSSMVPGSGLNHMVLIALDLATGVPVVLSGGGYSSGDAPLFVAPDGVYPSAYVRLYDTTTGITQPDLTDARDFFGGWTASAVAGRVLISDLDTTADYLQGGLVAGGGIALTVLGSGGSETLEVSLENAPQITEEDGNPDGNPGTLKFPDGSLTDNEDGSFSFSPTLLMAGGSPYIPAQKWALATTGGGFAGRLGELFVYYLTNIQEDAVFTQYLVPTTDSADLELTLFLSSAASGQIRVGVGAYVVRSGGPLVVSASMVEETVVLPAAGEVYAYTFSYGPVSLSSGAGISQILPGDVLYLYVYRDPLHGDDTHSTSVAFIGAKVGTTGTLVAVPQSGAFTADAYLVYLATGTWTADALITSPGSPFTWFTADAVIVGDVIHSSTFTDTNGTLVTAYTPDIGNAWAMVYGIEPTIEGNVLAPVDDAIFAVGTTLPVTTGFRAQLDFHVSGTGNMSWAEPRIYIQGLPAGVTEWAVLWDSGGFYIRENTTTRAWVNPGSLSFNTWYTLAVEVQGTQIRAYLTGPGTDWYLAYNSFVNDGTADFGFSGTSDASLGYTLLIDNVLVTPIATQTETFTADAVIA